MGKLRIKNISAKIKNCGKRLKLLPDRESMWLSKTLSSAVIDNLLDVFENQKNP